MSQYLVKCSCGWVAVPFGLGEATEAVVKLSLPDIGDHWGQGHKVTTRTIEAWDMVRRAVIGYARAQGLAVDESRVPVAPRIQQAQAGGVDALRADLNAAIRVGDLQEAMRIAMKIRFSGGPPRRADWPW